VSGIAGLRRLDGAFVARKTIADMIASLTHRGGDRSGVWLNQDVALAHQMLHTTPESVHEIQPFVDHLRGLIIVADARIDNREELISALNLQPASDAPITDVEIISAAYSKWADSCAEHILGDFVFVIWDTARRQFHCARDRFGVKVFYYVHKPGALFAFASEAKALFQLPEVSRRLNETHIAEFLALMTDNQTTTFFEDVVRLPAAFCMTVTADGIQSRCYASADPLREVRLRSSEEYAEAFRELFERAVRCRLRGIRPIGSFLSGGLDSSSITCMASRLLRESHGGPLHSFSMIFPGFSGKEAKRIDEREYMQHVVRHSQVEPHYIEADKIGPFDDMERIFWHQDEAFMAPNLYLHWATFLTANRAGVGIILDGYGGDSTVSHGGAYLEELARAGRWIKLWQQSAALAARKPGRKKAWDLMWSLGLSQIVPQNAWNLWRSVRHRNRPASQPVSIINSSFVQRIGGIQQRSVPPVSSKLPAGRRAHYIELTSGLSVHGLEVLDKAAAAFSLDARYPFFDWRLAEFCLAVPTSEKLQDGWSRMIFRRAMNGILPEEVRWRPTKGDLSPNWYRGFVKDRAQFERLVRQPNPILSSYINIDAVKAAFDRLQVRPARNQVDALVLYRTLMLNRWFETTNVYV